ncbi:group II truncated hemoglobin [Amnibacterium sp. CER49]|uniref:group II truncated hemoglobin n=1 Tax=Amnibacterium sp. CER49 TaxID=3039161 RepID=UPI002448B66B|nr:group II truncated hemoglobin [Amnibacterium sp. CER49]MDH2444545.1 group II truncated hemoglobin [Amnibacterium sp. CER49]
MPTLFEGAGGLPGLRRLADAWHARVLADPVVSHAFSHGFRDDHIERLAAYWAEALGGPPEYTERYGTEADVVRLHSGNGPHDEMNERAVACFDAALRDVGLDRDERLATVLHDYFAWATWNSMYRHHGSTDEGPRDLPVQQWSWDGRVPGAGVEES